jgi:hypothetical protein
VKFKAEPEEVFVGDVRRRLCDELDCQKLAIVRKSILVPLLPAIRRIERSLCKDHAKET